jgi:PhnB protein
MNFLPHLTFPGQCEEAFTFYEKSLGGRISLMMKHEDVPGGALLPDGWSKKIVHATLVLGEQELAGSDVITDQYRQPQGFSVLLNVGDGEEADRIFAALSEGGVVHLSMRETCWALRFGVVTDRFATPWEINCGRPVDGTRQGFAIQR